MKLVLSLSFLFGRARLHDEASLRASIQDFLLYNDKVEFRKNIGY